MKKTLDNFSLAIGSLALIGAIILQIKESLSWGHNSWQITEWLINYQGGFVRRGLPGQILMYISDFFGIQANHVAILISLFLYLFLLIFILIKSKDKFIILLILSPVVMGAPAYQDFIIRKDVLGIIYLLICLKILDSRGSDETSVLRYSAVNIISIIAILSHESFFFFAIPAIAVVISKYEIKGNFLKSILHGLIMLSPSVLIFWACVFFKGDPTVAKAIHHSWMELWRIIEPNNCCLDQPSAAIDALQWTTKKGLSLSYSTLFTFSKGIYVPLAWLITIFASIYFLMSFTRNPDSFEYKRFLNILIFQIIMISPLFVLGWDFGRWIFLWIMSSLILFIYGANFENSAVIHFYPFLKKLKQEKIKHYISKNSWILLVFGIPGCCWSFWGYIASTPIGYHFRKLVISLLVTIKNFVM